MNTTSRIALAISLAIISPATALDIYDDPGGNVGNRLDQIAVLRKSGEKVRIIGECTSACALYLSLPAEQICAVKGAVFGFHAVSYAAKLGADVTRKKNGKPVMHTPEAQELYASYFPVRIRNWIKDTGVMLSLKVTYSPALDFVQDCAEMESKLVSHGPSTQVGNTWFTEQADSK